MRKFFLPAAFSFLALTAFVATVPRENSEVLETSKVEYPADVKAIIDKSCYGCHSDKGQSEDAKKALHWDKLTQLGKGKAIAKLASIAEVAEKGEMPPSKFLEKYPNAKPSAQDVAALVKWAKGESDKLLGK